MKKIKICEYMILTYEVSIHIFAYVFVASKKRIESR